MSKRLWKKVAKNRKQSKKREQKTTLMEPVGMRVGPEGGELLVTSCAFCGYPTTETWVLRSGESGCERCVIDEKEAVFCRILEKVGDEAKMHILGKPTDARNFQAHVEA